MDILTYFNQLLPVLENDDSLYCISAWNDQVIVLMSGRKKRTDGWREVWGGKGEMGKKKGKAERSGGKEG